MWSAQASCHKADNATGVYSRYLPNVENMRLQSVLANLDNHINIQAPAKHFLAVDVILEMLFGLWKRGLDFIPTNQEALRANIMSGVIPIVGGVRTSIMHSCSNRLVR